MFDNPTVRWLATRRKDNMYALACDLMVTPRGEVKDRVWCGSVLKGLYWRLFVSICSSFLALYIVCVF